VNDQHDFEQLAAYTVGLLDAQDARATEAHVKRCQHCLQELTELRHVDIALRELPPELFLDGPPQGGDLVLRRALRQVRQERGVRRGHQRLAFVAAAVAVLAGVGAAGVALGRGIAGETITAAPATPTAPAKPAAPGSRVLTGFDQPTGARMTATVTPAAGWVRIEATVVGIPAGERCMLVVVDRGRDRYIAASWLVSPTGEEKGTTVEGAAVVVPGDVTAVTVTNFEGREFVIARA
jgi:hypothetical protein